jgi:hypothetical protein
MVIFAKVAKLILRYEYYPSLSPFIAKRDQQEFYLAFYKKAYNVGHELKFIDFVHLQTNLFDSHTNLCASLPNNTPPTHD